jgi:hypothetical protein
MLNENPNVRVSAEAGGGSCPSGNGLFLLYYGLIQNPASGDEFLPTIMSPQPNFVIFADGDSEQRRRSDIPDYVHRNGGRAIMYVALGYGQRDSGADIDGKVTDAMNAGYDGIFFDEHQIDPEVPPREDPRLCMRQWNTYRANHVKGFGASKLRIFNPGVIPPSDEVFQYADIVSVENKYNQPLPSFPGVAQWRWLAVQGDPKGDPDNLPPSSAIEARDRARAFRNNGGFWYYSSNRDATDPLRATHIYLPPWYLDFANWVKLLPGPNCRNEDIPMIIDILLPPGPLWVNTDSGAEYAATVQIALPSHLVGSKVTAKVDLIHVHCYDFPGGSATKAYIKQVNIVNGPPITFLGDTPETTRNNSPGVGVFDNVESVVFELWARNAAAWTNTVVFVHS